MLIGRPTEHGTGIEIFGDYWDLKSLYETVHSLAGIEDEDCAPGNVLLMEFAYEIRKANDNRRETDMSDFADELIIYRGFKIFWTNLFVIVKQMRENARIIKSTPDIQSDIYRLESIVENCLKKYDTTTGEQIFEWLSLSNVPKTEYMDLLVMQITYKNLQTKDGISRFKQLRKGIEALQLKHPEHKDFKKFLEVEAKRLKCKIKDLDLNLDYEVTGFKW